MSRPGPTLICVTYNVLGGLYEERIFGNVLRLISEYGAHILCLQEVYPEFGPRLRAFLAEKAPGWAVQFLAAQSLAIAWNEGEVRATSFSSTLLPLPPRNSLARAIAGDILNQRGVLKGDFVFRDTPLQVIVTHLDWEGGHRHRLRQLSALNAWARSDTITREIICGDFNTLHFFNSGTILKEVLSNVEQGFVNAEPEVRWTYDLRDIRPAHPWRHLLRLLYHLKIRFRMRLDYVLVRNLAIESSYVLDFRGSDHRPVLAHISL